MSMGDRPLATTSCRASEKVHQEQLVEPTDQPPTA
jgi:hypothetical protein